MNKELYRMQMLAGIITEGQYKKLLERELQYFHNGRETNQIINYDDDSITDDLEFLGMGSMDGQDFTPGETYNIGGQEYKVEVQGDEFKLVLAEALNEAVEVPTWLKSKLKDVHVKPGQGSIFSKPIDTVLKLAQDALGKENNIDKIANSTGTLTVKSPGIGYNLVLPLDQAKKLPGAKEGEVEKIEGPNKVKVPSITTTAPLTQFKSDELTVIVRPKKDESGKVIPNEYIVLSAFPGDPSIPRASEWNGKYAVIIPNSKNQTLSEEFIHMQKLAGIIIENKYKKKIQENSLELTSVDILAKALEEVWNMGRDNNPIDFKGMAQSIKDNMDDNLNKRLGDYIRKHDL